MAVCNVFSSLSKKTGTFLTFSQYAESMTNNNQKVIPTKFVAINIHRPNLSDYAIPKILQDYYENKIAVIKNDGAYGVSNVWKNKYSKDLFWRMMFDHFIDNDDIMYVGDINIQSYEEYGGTGYSEIYCYIPNDAKRCSYGNLTPADGLILAERYDGQYIEGYDESDYDLGDQIKLDSVNGKSLSAKVTKEDGWTGSSFKYDGATDLWYDMLTPTETTNVESYTFNTVVVLYNVIDKTSGRVLQNNQPMGIYFTGLYDQANQTITNPVTKYVSSQEICNQGTSYGVRICTKHIVGSSSSLVNEFQVSQDTKSELGYALSQMSLSQSKMDEVITHTYNCVQNYKDLAAIFKNSKTNVPYIKLIDGKEYWFVNGRRVSSASIDDGELEHVCGINIEAKLLETRTNKEVKAISVERLLSESINLTFKFVVKSGDLILGPRDISTIKILGPNNYSQNVSVTDDSLSDGSYEKRITISQYTTNNKYDQSYNNYTIQVTLSDGQIVNENIGYLVTHPSYIGLIRTIKSNGDKINWKDYLMPENGVSKFDDKLEGLLGESSFWAETPETLVLENQEYIYNYTNGGYDISFTGTLGETVNGKHPYHVCYIYPATYSSDSNIDNRLSTVSSCKLLTSIKDSRDLEYINDFEKIGENVDNYYPYIIKKFGETAVLYNVYIDKIPAFVNNYTLSFK